MAQYYQTRPSITRNTVEETNNLNTAASENASGSVLTEFDKQRRMLITDDAEEGWASELRRYLGNMRRDIEKDVDLVEWWQVWNFFNNILVGMQRILITIL
jgi:hypothetical protein